VNVEASDASAGQIVGLPRVAATRTRAERPGTAELEQLFREHERGLGQFLRQLVNDPTLADDLIQETFLAAARERERLPSIERPKAWLFQIARNRALHAMRGRRRAFAALQRLTREVGIRSRHLESAADPADAMAVREHLAAYLKPEERALLILRYVHGFKSPELAEIVGRSPDAVRQELSRTRRKLIKSLGDQDQGRA
jgi:RNA polymerase sigma-70 factor (ECF subfamily)